MARARQAVERLVTARWEIDRALYYLGVEEDRREERTGLTRHERVVVNRAIALVRKCAPGPRYSAADEEVARTLLWSAVKALGKHRRAEKALR
jgi:hypothetical protein